MLTPRMPEDVLVPLHVVLAVADAVAAVDERLRDAVLATISISKRLSNDDVLVWPHVIASP